jgi:hypothetical protein
MSPLLLVGILLSTALADVVHVKGGTAPTVPSPSEVNSLVNNKKTNQQEFWWMGPDSPMKAAYEYYKKCSKTGNCLPPINLLPGGAKEGDFALQPIDVKKNPFLNGVYEAGSSADFSTSSSETKSTGVPSTSSIDLSKNPFLNGAGIQSKKPGFATSHPLENKKPFATSLPGQAFDFNANDEDNEVSPTVPCIGQGKVCVPKDACVNGFASKHRGDALQIRQNVNNCKRNTEVCCNLSGGSSFPTSINDLLDNSAKSFQQSSAYKFTSKAAPGQVQIINDASGDSNPQISHHGASGATNKANTAKPTRDISTSANSVFSSTPDYSDVQFDSDVRFSNLLHGPAYLPPKPPTPKPCPAGTYLNAEGICVPRTEPACPFGTTRQPDGSCRRPEPQPCPIGTERQPDGSCLRPTPAPCPFGTLRQPDGSCRRPEPPTPAPCPFGTSRQPDGSCARPEPPTPAPCPFGTLRQPDGSCRRPQPPPCPFGTVSQPDGTCFKPTPEPYCPSETERQSDGTCKRPQPSTCPFGTERQPDGNCLRPTPQPCPSGTARQPDGSCRRPEPPTPAPWPFGTYRQPDGRCKRPEPPTPAPCPSGTLRQPDGSCRRPEPPTPAPCPFGTERQPDGSCLRPTPQPCPSGTARQPDGSCKRPEPPTPAPCPFGTLRQPDGSCRRPQPPPCPSGTVTQPDGTCLRPKPAPCPSGTTRQPDGSCQRPIPYCPAGTVRQPDGTCEKPIVPEPSCPFGVKTKPGQPCQCPPGDIRQPNGSCRKPEPSPCPSGTFRQPDGSCRRPQPPPCPIGTVRQPDGSCQRREPKRCNEGYRLTPAGDCIPDGNYLPPTPKPTTDDGYHYERPTPAFELPSKTTGSSGIIPGPTTEHEGLGSNINSEVRQPDNKGESANTNNVFITTKGPVKGPTKGPIRTPPPFNPDEVQAPAGCAAALKCVQEIYCTPEGVVSPVPVVLTPQQELLRVPTTVCRDIETGILGKCCRDPNYKDPWPSANLVDGIDDGQYKEDNFYGQHNLNSNRLVRAPNVTKTSVVRKRQSVRNTQNEIKEVAPTCGEVNLNSSPVGPGPLDANFAQYPWQAMILRDTNRSLLCGGAIIARDAVLTAAHCVEGLQTSDVLVKGGEWKLGIDEEPLPFQIINVAAIVRHPRYQEAGYDLAILKLKEKFRWSKNVGSICLPDLKTSLGNCKVTGWGKRILQLHARGAIMHHIDVKMVEDAECQKTLSEKFPESLPNYKEHTLCATSNIDQCKVDYGSALACTNDQGKYVVAGIFGWDTGCKQESQIGGYIPTDGPWIEATLQKPLKELRRLDREYLLNSKI